MQKTGFCISEGVSKVQDTPSFLLFHRFSSSDYAELTEHSCFTDYARNLNGKRPVRSRNRKAICSVEEPESDLFG